MLKALGALAVMAGAAIWGIRQYAGFLSRRNTLRSIYDGSSRVENILRCRCAPLHESFQSGGEFFSLAAEKIFCGTPPEEAVIQTCGCFCGLNAEDLAVISRFAKGLNADDCKGQIDNLTLFKAGLEKQLADASKELQLRGKLCIKGSVLTAAAVVLLLL